MWTIVTWILPLWDKKQTLSLQPQMFCPYCGNASWWFSTFWGGNVLWDKAKCSWHFITAEKVMDEIWPDWGFTSAENQAVWKAGFWLLIIYWSVTVWWMWSIGIKVFHTRKKVQSNSTALYVMLILLVHSLGFS